MRSSRISMIVQGPLAVMSIIPIMCTHLDNPEKAWFILLQSGRLGRLVPSQGEGCLVRRIKARVVPSDARYQSIEQVQGFESPAGLATGKARS